MLTKRVCLVLGAGSSDPYGFPTGGGLLSFARRPDDDWWPIAAKLFNADKQYHEQFLRARVASGAESLDDFVGRRTEFKNYVLALIAYYVGTCESSSTILGASNNDNDWMTFFIRRMVEGVDRLEDLKNTKLSVVTFNFDRCFEETLLIRLSDTYRKPSESGPIVRQRVAETIKAAMWPIVHVHGDLGTVPELALGAGRAYQRTADPEEVLRASQRLKLLDDAQADSEVFQTARKQMKEAECVFFLGFGFHRLNCKRVIPDWPAVGQPALYGTVKDMKQGRLAKAHSYLRASPSAMLLPVSCLQLLEQLENHFSD